MKIYPFWEAVIDLIISLTCTFLYWWFVFLVFPLQHPSVSILSHPGGRWGEAVGDVRRSAAHNAVQQPRSHRRKPRLYQLAFKLWLCSKQKLEEKSFFFAFFFQGTATEDVAESLSPDDGEFPQLALGWRVSLLLCDTGKDLLSLRVRFIDIYSPGWSRGQDACRRRHPTGLQQRTQQLDQNRERPTGRLVSAR